MASHDVDALATMAWEAALPVRCILAEGCNDPGQQGAMTDCYFMVPRQGYLGYSLKVVMRTFSHLSLLADTSRCYVWFTYKPPRSRDAEEVLVPWHYPMGVIVDRLAAETGEATVTKLFESGALVLTVTFSETPPTGDLVIPMTVRNVEKGVTTWVKQGHKAYLMARYGSLKAWVNLEPSAYEDFVSAPRTNDVGQFFVGRSAIESQCKRDVESDAYAAGEKRAYIVMHINGSTVPMVVDTESVSTLGTLLRFALPCCYDLSDDDVQSLDPLPASLAEVFVLGTKPPLLVPVEFLRDHLCCADLAVHIVVSTKADNKDRPRPVREASPLDGAATSMRFLPDDPHSPPAGARNERSPVVANSPAHLESSPQPATTAEAPRSTSSPAPAAPEAPAASDEPTSTDPGASTAPPGDTANSGDAARTTGTPPPDPNRDSSL